MLGNVRFVAGRPAVHDLLAVAASSWRPAGTVGALGRISKNPVAYGVAGFYTSFFRGTPLIVQLFLIYLALPQIGRNLARIRAGCPTLRPVADPLAVQAGIIGLGLNYGAYLTEIFRAGIQAVAARPVRGGRGARHDLPQKMRRVVLPQALRVIIPPTGNEFIAMIKDTALVSFLGVAADQAEVFRRASWWARATSGTSRRCCRRAHLLGAHRRSSRSSRRGWSAGSAGVRAHVGGRALDRAGAQLGPVAPLSRRRPRRRAVTMTTDRDAAPGIGPVVGSGPAQVLRLPRGAHERRPGRAPQRGRGDLRSVGVREEHVAALPELPRGPDRGHDRGRRIRARGRLPDPSQARARSASCGCAPAWCSSSSTCSRT